MNYTAESIREMTEMVQIVLNREEGSVEEWLDIAFKLDYITYKERDTIMSLLKKWRNVPLAQTNVTFGKTNYQSLKRMKEIVKNTRLPVAFARA